jgi:hypothetical protein
MLWFDSRENESTNKKADVKTEREKILEAVAYYEKKYGIRATEVHINPDSDFSIKKDAIENLTVEKDRYVLKNHMIIFGA